MLNGIFDMDKPFWRWIGKLPEMIGLSFCWYICCLPLITFIPASCALYDAVSRCLITDEKGCFKRFFRTFVQELKKGIPLSLLWIFILAFSVLGLNILQQNAQTNPVLANLHPFYLAMIVMTIGYLSWLIPLQSRFHNNFWTLHINALRFAIGRLWGSLAMLLITVGVVILCFLHTMTIPLLVIAPCLIATLHAIPVERSFRVVFPQYYEDEAEQ